MFLKASLPGFQIRSVDSPCLVCFLLPTYFLVAVKGSGTGRIGTILEDNMGIVRRIYPCPRPLNPITRPEVEGAAGIRADGNQESLSNHALCVRRQRGLISGCVCVCEHVHMNIYIFIHILTEGFHKG